MNSCILKFDELTDSREVLNGKEPNFILFFIVMILFILIISFIWLWLGKIDVIIKATGIVRPLQNVSSIYNYFEGKIENINYESGQHIIKDELLYSIESSQLELEKDHILKKINKLKREITLLKELKTSIEIEKNLLSQNDIIYFNRFLAFKTNYLQLVLDYNQAKNRYLREKRLTSKFTTARKLEQLETAYKYAELSRDKYRTETIVSIIEEINNKSAKLEQLSQQLKQINQKIISSNITAPISGTIQVCQQFNTGDYMPAGIEVLRIIPDSDSRLKMQITVKNKDISQLQLGQIVKYRFLSFPYREYGILTGKIKKIGSDVLKGQQGPNSPYIVEASIIGNELLDDKGRSELIKVGMLAETRIVTRKRKLLYLVLEKLDFID